MEKLNLAVSGMHCKSCEKLLEDELSDISGIAKVRASQRKNIIEIFFEGDAPDRAEITKVVEKLGYKIGKDVKIDYMNNRTDWFYAMLLVIAIIFMFHSFQRAGIIDRLSVAAPSLNFEISFLIGLVASVSSCLAVVGGVVIAFAEKYRTDGNDFWKGSFVPNLSFHIGRMVTFFVLGGLLGLIGGGININGNLISAYTVIISVIMFWLGLNILGIVPSISSLGLSMPKDLTERWKNIEKSENKMAPFLLGLLSFFLPCGFTQSMQILALASGSFWSGAMGLFAFSLGTAPALMALGVTTSWTKNKKIEIIKIAAGMIIILFSFYTLQSGLALRGMGGNIFSAGKKALGDGKDKEKTIGNNDTQTVEMHIAASGFQPSTIRIKKNMPVQWVIYGDSVSGCTNKMIIPSLDIEKNIVSGKNIINFMPPTSGEISFSCWMGMVRGKFVVE